MSDELIIKQTGTIDVMNRLARKGDICVMISTSDSGEINQLRRQQVMFKNLLGGRITDLIHLTCQRVELPEDLSLETFLQNLNQAINAYAQTFPLTAASMLPVYSNFRKCYILKWQIEPNDDLRHFTHMLEETLLSMNIQLIYRRGLILTWVSALEDIPEPVSESILAMATYPHHLFTATRVIISRINGPFDYERLATLSILK